MPPVLLNLLISLIASTAVRPADPAGPCDIYGAAGTPCVAAHSMVRALYGGYEGPLYRVKRASDNATHDVGVVSRGGLADAAAQDKFCAGGVACTVDLIYDQSPQANHLGLAPGGGMVPEPDVGVNASRSPLALSGGHKVYGAYFEGGMGYRNDNTSGVPRGDAAESMYMVASGRHFNNLCCFDYGNAEADDLDDGVGTMEAIYFGNSTHSGWGFGAGPWVMADLEDGLWGSSEHYSPKNTPMLADFVTAMLKGKPGGFALKGGDASRAGSLATLYEGPRPDKYDPMKKQGAIVLGVGGDNSNWAVGTFYEGAMAAGYASDATDAAIHANIAAAGYGA